MKKLYVSYTVMSSQQKTGQNYNKNRYIINIFKMLSLKYLEKTTANQNYINYEVKSR
jgi:hypothetical protein